MKHWIHKNKIFNVRNLFVGPYRRRSLILNLECFAIKVLFEFLFPSFSLFLLVPGIHNLEWMKLSYRKFFYPSLTSFELESASALSHMNVKPYIHLYIYSPGLLTASFFFRHISTKWKTFKIYLKNTLCIHWHVHNWYPYVQSVYIFL